MNRKQCVTWVVLVCVQSVFGQGSLTPPGAPGATMKTLDQLDASIGAVSNAVEQIKGDPRTPISSVPYTISEPGSYYLTTNLSSTGRGVIIRASNVTLDLMGFTLSGDRGSSDRGIFLDGATNSTIRNVMVHNGIVRNFGDGLRAEYAQNSRFERLRSEGNYYYGIYLAGFSGQCDGNTITECTVRKNVNGGIGLNYADGNRVDGNHVTGQTGVMSYGIYCFNTAQNLIVRNACVGQVGNFGMSANDTYGTIVTNTGALSGTDPWANFSR